MRLIYLLIIIFLTTSCKKEVIDANPPYIEQWWDQFYGNYSVIDTLNDTVYLMTLEPIERYFDGRFFMDSIQSVNILDQFTPRFKSELLNSNTLSIGSHNLLLDKNGLKWFLSGTFYWNEELDTLKLDYKKSNIAYYLEDGVPYLEIIATDFAVKLD